MNDKPLARPDVWRQLRAVTPARIALGRAGGSLPTGELLDFQLAHARARDAVHAPFDAARLADEICQLGVTTLCLRSAAHDRQTFLQRPDLGRRLDTASRELLATAAAKVATCDVSEQSDADTTKNFTFDLAIMVSDGLSALAAELQVVPLLREWLPLLRAERRTVAPVIVVERARVAIEDEIGRALSARVAVILLGERPGLGSPDSLGAYLVYDPRPGATDADRNCVSNIRPGGLAPAVAALKLHYLVCQSLARQISGVPLKDESHSLEVIPEIAPGNRPQLPANGST